MLNFHLIFQVFHNKISIIVSSDKLINVNLKSQFKCNFFSIISVKSTATIRLKRKIKQSNKWSIKMTRSSRLALDFIALVCAQLPSDRRDWSLYARKTTHDSVRSNYRSLREFLSVLRNLKIFRLGRDEGLNLLPMSVLSWSASLRLSRWK